MANPQQWEERQDKPLENRYYTLKEYWKFVEDSPDQRYEYVNGLIRLLAGGAAPHSGIAINIATQLNVELRKKESPCRVYGADMAVALQGDKVYIPDVSVSCDPYDQTQRRALESPSVIVEVLSPSTERTDREEKLPAYQAEPFIFDILYVDARRRRVEHYHQTENGAWQVRTCTRNEDLLILTGIDVSFSLRNIYEGIYLEQEEA